MRVLKTANLYIRSVHCLLASALYLTAVFSVSAGTYDWSNDYTVEGTQGWDDNFRLSEDDPVETNSTSLSLSGELRGADEVSSVRLRVGANGTTYSDSSIEDSEDYGIFAGFKRRTGERWLGTLDLSYGVTPTTKSELLDTGELVDGEQESTSISPSLNYQIDERSSIYANVTVTDVSYDTVSLTDYTDNAAAAGWIYGLTEISDISINVNTSEYEPDGGERTRISGANLGFGFYTSEPTRYDLVLGYSETDGPGGTGRDGNSSITITHNIDERNNFSLFAGNGYAGSASGDVRYQSELSMLWNHQLSENIQFDLSAEGVRSDERDYYSLIAGTTYRFSRAFYISASYKYRKQQSDTNDADSNSIFFTIRYSPVSSWSHLL